MFSKRFPRIAQIVASLALAVLAGCGWPTDEHPEDEGSHPSASTLRDLRVQSGLEPIFWLGESFAGKEISGAELTDEGAWVSYGKRSCDVDSGCTSFPIVIATYSGWPSPYLPPASRRHTCFDHIRGGVLISDCRNSRHRNAQWGDLYVGPRGTDRYAGTERVTLSISGPIGERRGLTIEDLARAVYPMDAQSSVPGNLPPPEAVPCPKLQYLVRWWVVANRREIGRNPLCDLDKLLGLS